MEANEETIFIIQKIDDLRLKPKSEREIIFDKGRSRHNLERYQMDRKNRSLELMDRFKRFLKEFNLKKVELEGVNEKNQELIEFILKDRIKKKLVYKHVVNLNGDYQLFFFPECPRNLVYRIFIVISTTLKNIENDMIKYLRFIKNSEFRGSLELDPEIHTYIKINPKFEFINTFVERFSFSENKKLYRIKLEPEDGEEEFNIKSTILIGDENNYLLSRGLAYDLNYILIVKEYYKKVI